GGIVHDNNTFLLLEDLAEFSQIEIIFEFNINRFRVPTYNRDTYSSGGNPDTVISHDFIGLLDHFHLFLGVPVVLEYITVRNDIEVNLVSVDFLALNTRTLVIHLLYRFHPCACDRLVGRYHDAFDFIFIMQWLQY